MEPIFYVIRSILHDSFFNDFDIDLSSRFEIGANTLISMFGYFSIYWIVVHDWGIDVVYLSKDVPPQVDYVFQNLMLFQVIFIQRIVLTMLIVGLIFYERCLVRGFEWVNSTLQFCRGHFNEADQTIFFLKEVVV